MKRSLINDSIRSTRNEIEAEIKRLNRILAVLNEGIEADAPDAGQQRKMIAVAPPGRKRMKAPKDSLATAILHVLAHTKRMTNSELRSAIRSSGYKYSLLRENVRQICVKLKKEGKIVSEGDGNSVRYSLSSQKA